MLRPYRRGFNESPVASHGFLIAAGPGERVDECASSGTVIPNLKGRIKIKDIRRSEAAAGAVNREDRVAIDFVEVDVFQYGAAPVREVEKIHARLVGVDAGLDGDAA